MVRALPYIIPVALAIFTLIEVARAQPWELGGLPRWAWVGIVLLPVVGPVAWLVLSRMRRAEARAAGTAGYPGTGSGAGAGSGTTGPLPRRRGPVAPDDDPDFLWRLDQDARRRRRDEGGPAAESPSDESRPDESPSDEPQPDKPRPDHPQPESAPEDDPRP